MYLEEVVAAIRKHLPADKLPVGDSAGLMLLYAVLLRAKGGSVTQSDVHDAWSAWMSGQNPAHESLVPFSNLPREVQEEDEVFARAIHQAAEELQIVAGSTKTVREVLFPFGPPRDAGEAGQLLDLYKIMVQSSESLVGRRQSVNTFFLTMNGALLTGSGIIVQNSGSNKVGALGIAVLSLAGVILCAAWRSLIVSFGQLNGGKFVVINSLERHLRAAIYAAEWVALGSGKDPSVYRSFTSREIWVPTSLFFLHLTALIAALAVNVGLFRLA
jgi:hypothetical protein